MLPFIASFYTRFVEFEGAQFGRIETEAEMHIVNTEHTCSSIDSTTTG